MTQAPQLQEISPSRKLLRRCLLILLGLVVYVVTAVPVGMFVYTVKSDLGWNVFQKTGYHGFLQCIQNEAQKIQVGMNE